MPHITSTPPGVLIRASAGFRFILLLGLLDALGPLGIDMYLPAFPRIAADFHASPAVMPLTLSLFLAGLAIGQLVTGPISDRVGRKLPLVCGSVAFAAASVVCAFTRSIEALIVARFVMGLAGAAGMVIARAVVRDSFDEADSARVYSLLMLVIGIAPILSPSVGGWLMALGSWSLIFWALAAFAIACGIAVAVDLPETHPVGKRSKASAGSIGRAYRSLATDGGFLHHAAPVSLALGVIFAYVAAAPGVFMEFYGLSSQQFSYLFAGNAVGLIGAAQLNRWLTRRFDTHAILKGATLVNAVSSVALIVVASTGWGGLPAFVAAIFVCLATVGLTMPNATAAAMAPFPEKAGAASALLGMSQFTLGAATGAVVGLLHDGTPRPMAVTVAGCAILAAAITWLGADRCRSIEATHQAVVASA